MGMCVSAGNGHADPLDGTQQTGSRADGAQDRPPPHSPPLRSTAQLCHVVAVPCSAAGGSHPSPARLPPLPPACLSPAACLHPLPSPVSVRARPPRRRARPRICGHRSSATRGRASSPAGAPPCGAASGCLDQGIASAPWSAGLCCGSQQPGSGPADPCAAPTKHSLTAHPLLTPPSPPPPGFAPSPIPSASPQRYLGHCVHAALRAELCRSAG